MLFFDIGDKQAVFDTYPMKCVQRPSHSFRKWNMLTKDLHKDKNTMQ